MLRFAQKLSDNVKKIIFTLISEINELKELSFEKIMKLYFFFKTHNSSSKTFILSWINLSSCSLRNYWWHWRWRLFDWSLNRQKIRCSFSFFTIFLSCEDFSSSLCSWKTEARSNHYEERERMSDFLFIQTSIKKSSSSSLSTIS